MPSDDILIIHVGVVPIRNVVCGKHIPKYRPPCGSLRTRKTGEAGLRPRGRGNKMLLSHACGEEETEQRFC